MGSAASLRAGTLLAVLLLVFPLSVSEGYQVGWSRREDCQDSRQLSLWDTGGNALLARTSFRWAKAWEHRDMPAAGSSVGGCGGPGPLTGAVLLGVRDPEGEQGEKGAGPFIVMRGLPSSCDAWAPECVSSIVAARQCSRGGAQAWLLCSMWDLPGPGFLTTGPPQSSSGF